MKSTVPSETALLLIDPLNDFISEGGKVWPHLSTVASRLDTVANLGRLLRWARARRLPVVFVPHHRATPDDFEGWQFLNPTHAAIEVLQPFARGTWGAEFHPDLQPHEGDLVVHEHWLHDGFASTDLDMRLRMRGIRRLVIAGLRANTCVEGTARRAVELGYHVTLVKDATAAFRLEEWSATMEINAATFAHAVVTTEELLGRTSSAEVAS